MQHVDDICVTYMLMKIFLFLSVFYVKENWLQLDREETEERPKTYESTTDGRASGDNVEILDNERLV